MPFYGIITDKGMRTFSRALNAEVPEKYWIAVGYAGEGAQSQPSSTTNDIEGEISRDEATVTSSGATITFYLDYTVPAGAADDSCNMIGIFDRSSGGDCLYLGYYHGVAQTGWPITPVTLELEDYNWEINVQVTVANA